MKKTEFDTTVTIKKVFGCNTKEVLRPTQDVQQPIKLETIFQLELPSLYLDAKRVS